MALVVDGGFPVLEEVADHPHIIVLFGSGLVDLVLELWGLDQFPGIPLGHPGHAVESSEFEVRVDVSDVDLCLPGLLHWVLPGRLVD